MDYIPPFVSLSDAQPWAWFVFGVLALVGVLTVRRWPNLSQPVLIGLCIGGLAAYLVSVRILSVDPNRDLGYIPLWTPLAWCAAFIATLLPWATVWAFGVGLGGALSKNKTGKRVAALAVLLCSVAVFQVAMWCTEIVLD
ncbi:MAG: hypothetical protein ABI689_11720 [Thermoanaerobaculia bacterium]